MIPPDHAADRAAAADDLALVRRIADGDPLALSALYDRHSQAIYSHAFHLLGDAAEGEDALEETFWRVWLRASDYDPSVPDVATWLLMICRQRAAERLRTKKRPDDRVLEDTTGLEAGGVAAPGEGPDGDRARVAATLAAIPVEQRTVLELAFFRGMAPVDVASVTKQSPETARTRLRVAMRKLRDALGETASQPADGNAEGNA